MGGSEILPIGYLMKEHRLIEKMVDLLKKKAGIDLIENFVDFFTNFTDNCHHQKEENFLFKELYKKDLSGEHKALLDILMQEHVEGRRLIGDLEFQRERYESGQKDALVEIEECVKNFIQLYTGHIYKEDKQFFIPSMQYFSKQEQADMIDKFYEFDRLAMYNRYKNMVDDIK